MTSRLGTGKSITFFYSVLVNIALLQDLFSLGFLSYILVVNYRRVLGRQSFIRRVIRDFINVRKNVNNTKLTVGHIINILVTYTYIERVILNDQIPCRGFKYM